VSAAEPPASPRGSEAGERSRRRSGANHQGGAAETPHRPDWQLAVAPWIVARVVVAAGFAVAMRLFDRHGTGVRPASLLQGLLTYDADFYRSIAEEGYQRTGGSLRFFPLVPTAAKALSLPFGDHVDIALLVIANACAFGFLVVLARVTRLETHDERVVLAVVWLGALAPPAVVLVLGYAEATLLLLSVGTFLFLRTERPGPAAALGFLAGLCRPFGIFLAVPAAIEVGRGWRTATTRERAWGVAAIVAPAAGVATYLVWVRERFGDAFLPLRIQQSSNLRGSFRDPISSVIDTATNLADRPTGLIHLVAIVGCIALLVVVIRRLPASYSAFAALSILLAVSAENLDSLERYALGAFPLLIGAGLLLRTPRVMRIVVAASGLGLLATSTAVFLARWVP